MMEFVEAAALQSAAMKAAEANAFAQEIAEIYDRKHWNTCRRSPHQQS